MDLLHDFPGFVISGAGISWHLITHLPWPHLSEIFGSMVVFICLYPLKIAISAVSPEKYVINTVKRRVYRKKTLPSTSEHQTASAAVQLMHHF